MDKCRYNEISNLCIEWLVYTWVEDLTEKTCAGVERKIRCFARGELEHATETISKLWKMLNKVETINAPTSPPLAVSPVRVSLHLRFVQELPGT